MSNNGNSCHCGQLDTHERQLDNRFGHYRLDIIVFAEALKN